MLTILELVLPAVVVFTTLFGVLARGDSKPGGVALFARVGIAGIVLGAAGFYLVEKTSALAGRPEVAVNAYRGLGGGGVLLLLFAIFGMMLKKRRE
jgi:hypothetical protein